MEPSISSGYSEIERERGEREGGKSLELELLMNLAQPTNQLTPFSACPLYCPCFFHPAAVAAFNQPEVAAIDAAHFKAVRCGGKEGCT